MEERQEEACPEVLGEQSPRQAEASCQDPAASEVPAEEEDRLDKLAAVVLHHMAVHMLERHRSTQVAEGLLLT